MTYQGVMAMETPASNSEPYYAQDDISEAQRHAKLTQMDNDDGSDESWQYDPHIHGDFDFDLSPGR